jgi:hypothetical protein
MRVKNSNVSTLWVGGRIVGMIATSYSGYISVDRVCFGIALNTEFKTQPVIYHHKIPWSNPTLLMDMWIS